MSSTLFAYVVGGQRSLATRQKFVTRETKLLQRDRKRQKLLSFKELSNTHALAKIKQLTQKTPTLNRL